MNHPEASARIAALLGQALASALASMTGKTFTVAPEPEGEPAEMDQAMIWRQTFSCSSEPVLWVAAGKDVWESAGQLTLGAVGLDAVTEDDCRSTWQEILGQTMGGFAMALSDGIQHEITSVKGDVTRGEPAAAAWTYFAARSDDTVWRLKAAWSKELIALYDPQAPDRKPAAGRDSTFSKTFDLLLDVALPVNVSFGKTFLQIREVLKLNTGSIVELNRFVTEPVDVIVNDCVIARGEVVVVDGNYGVRITQLASREDRLRSGMAETPGKTGTPAR
jgi:flagellar motor switch protein FliN